jgi:hypothetical protein
VVKRVMSDKLSYGQIADAQLRLADKAIKELERERDELRAENERQRAALLRIEEIVTRPGLTDDILVMTVYNLTVEGLGKAKDG